MKQNKQTKKTHHQQKINKYTEFRANEFWERKESNLTNKI